MADGRTAITSGCFYLTSFQESSVVDRKPFRSSDRDSLGSLLGNPIEKSSGKSERSDRTTIYGHPFNCLKVPKKIQINVFIVKRAVLLMLTMNKRCPKTIMKFIDDEKIEFHQLIFVASMTFLILDKKFKSLFEKYLPSFISIQVRFCYKP
ncbi:hypothetical protein BpHYR1_034106 [Brachionus plicatilis]|uniref:Uncharacterized protein n=1 Tax=Brachionus plicatilis TaxID=10195 RepID=A0A3M7PK36_BRAPC|nr:hypothetical protein BpHYR1_034106 [Brachionus plicatilis]